ncbi:hypothetical protein [uncultured Methylovirgula sp.]|uniref:hypothetical protein n=1 Tax=uncultured Methylovirgula sp. TaxID=1285960 RepID=UPI0026380146|nr:hypothetical protein [uncultured Methylovirgula sp.]
MERLVPVFDPRRKVPLAIRLGDVPSLFSEGPEPDESVRPARPSLTAVKERLRRLFVGRQDGRAPSDVN